VSIFAGRELTHIKVLLYKADGFTLLHRACIECFTLTAYPATAGSIQLSALKLVTLLQVLYLHTTKTKVPLWL
jgi:hypothetical protein